MARFSSHGSAMGALDRLRAASRPRRRERRLGSATTAAAGGGRRAGGASGPMLRQGAMSTRQPRATRRCASRWSTTRQGAGWIGGSSRAAAAPGSGGSSRSLEDTNGRKMKSGGGGTSSTRCIKTMRPRSIWRGPLKRCSGGIGAGATSMRAGGSARAAAWLTLAASVDARSNARAAPRVLRQTQRAPRCSPGLSFGNSAAPAGE